VRIPFVPSGVPRLVGPGVHEAPHPNTPYVIYAITHRHAKEGPREAVFQWELQVLGPLAYEHPLEPWEAYGFIARLWTIHAGRFAPYFLDPPQLHFVSNKPGFARYSWQNHTLSCNKTDTRRGLLLHELAHAMCWNDHDHGCDFAGTLVCLWTECLGLDRTAALTLAKRHEVRVNDSVPYQPSVPAHLYTDSVWKLNCPRRR
jgi:hypothetical protein